MYYWSRQKRNPKLNKKWLFIFRQDIKTSYLSPHFWVPQDNSTKLTYYGEKGPKTEKCCARYCTQKPKYAMYMPNRQVNTLLKGFYSIPVWTFYLKNFFPSSLDMFLWDSVNIYCHNCKQIQHVESWVSSSWNIVFTVTCFTKYDNGWHLVLWQ